MGAKVAKEDFVMVAKEAKVAKDMAFSVAKVTRVQDLPVAMTTTVARVAKVAKDHTMALSWTSVVNLLNFMVARVARVVKDMHITKMASVAKEVLALASVAREARVEMEEDLVLSMATTVAKVGRAALVSLPRNLV